MAHRTKRTRIIVLIVVGTSVSVQRMTAFLMSSLIFGPLIVFLRKVTCVLPIKIANDNSDRMYIPGELRHVRKLI